MTPESQPLLSSEFITAVAGLWKLAACIAAVWICYMFRASISRFLQNLRRIRSRDTEIDLTPSPEPTKSPETDVASAEKALPASPQQETPGEVVNGDALFAQLFDAIYQRHNDRAQELFTQWMEQEPGDSRSNEVVYYRLLCQLQGDSCAVDKLEAFRQDETYKDEHSMILETLAKFYESVSQYDKALDLYEEVVSSSVTPRNKITAAIEKQRIIAITQTPEESLPGLQELLREVTDDECCAIVYHQIAETFRLMGNDFMRCVALEKVLQYRVTDATARFDAAYAQSMTKLPYLALKNYELELSLNASNTNARNNYAVQLEKLGFSVRSVQEYVKARAEGSTLAAANLANRYIHQGLLGDAREILKAAQAMDRYHENVDHSLANLHKMEDAETERFEQTRKWLPVYRKVLQRFAECRLLPRDDIRSFAGSWRSRTGDVVVIEQDDMRFAAEWGNAGSRRKLEGVQVNHGADIKLYSELSSGLLFRDEEKRYGSAQDAVGYIGGEGDVMEILSYGGDTPQHWFFKRVT